MKKILFALIIILPFAFAFAQTEKLDKFPVDVQDSSGVSLREVGFMAVFPGCEKLNESDKVALQKCLQQNLTSLLSGKLQKYADKMFKQGLTSVQSKLQFVISRNGELIEIVALKGGNREFGAASEKAMMEVAAKINKIKPATLNDGTPVNLVFQLPIKYLIKESKIDQFIWNEIVMATFNDNSQKFEIRQDKQNNIKAYEIKDGKDLFLRKFNSLSEAISTEPYKTLYLQSGGKLLAAEKKIRNKIYKIYYSNTHNDFLESYKVENREEEFMESFPQESLVFSTLYLEIVLRK
ncbi:hypothetical protein [Moheibacter sp.]|uniref:hypothetical protein n=1 Tax=Moheibacter sp. TaxID=1965316 RepID=UPI003C793AB9